MKVRAILLILGLLVFLSVTTGGLLYYFSLKTSVLNNTEVQAGYHAEKIKNLISSYLVHYQKAVRALAGLKELKKALVNSNEIALAEANLILDHFNDSLKMSVSYLMDRKGKTIASSNRHDLDSFVGQNYSFRPYFKEAIDGNPAVYMALGVTSKRRGIYYSHPIHDSSQDSPIGVAVLKAGVDTIEEEFVNLRYGPGTITFITGPLSVVFMSDHKGFLYRLLWQVTDEDLVEFINSKQFGKGPWEWAGFKQKSEKRTVDKAGNEYLMFQSTIESLSGWNVVHLLDMKTLSKVIAAPFIRTIGYFVLTLCILVSLAVFILYNMGKSDIIRRLEAEESLRKSEERFEQVAENAGEWVWEVNTQGLYTYSSSVINKILGYQPEEIVGKKHFYDLFHPEDREQLKNAAFEVFTRKESFYNFLNRNIHKNGEEIFLSTSGVPVFDNEGNLTGYRGVDTNITEHMQAEKQIKASLKEKEILLQEIHHRVKNNMQVISSLLRLQASGVEDERLTDALMECQGRVQAMAFVHETLYGSDTLAVIDLKSYIFKIASQIFQTYQTSMDRIQLKVDAQDIKLGIEQATPMGLIVNELTSNALKYAFPENQSGEIAISIRAVEQNKIEFVFSDNGTGMPEGLDWQNTDTLGLQLVNILAEDQLDGTVQLDRRKGTNFTVRFRLEENR